MDAVPVAAFTGADAAVGGDTRAWAKTGADPAAKSIAGPMTPANKNGILEYMSFSLVDDAVRRGWMESRNRLSQRETAHAFFGAFESTKDKTLGWDALFPQPASYRADSGWLPGWVSVVAVPQ